MGFGVVVYASAFPIDATERSKLDVSLVNSRQVDEGLKLTPQYYLEGVNLFLE